MCTGTAKNRNGPTIAEEEQVPRVSLAQRIVGVVFDLAPTLPFLPPTKLHQLLLVTCRSGCHRSSLPRWQRDAQICLPGSLSFTLEASQTQRTGSSEASNNYPSQKLHVSSSLNARARDVVKLHCWSIAVVHDGEQYSCRVSPTPVRMVLVGAGS